MKQFGLNFLGEVNNFMNKLQILTMELYGPEELMLLVAFTLLLFKKVFISGVFRKFRLCQEL